MIPKIDQFTRLLHLSTMVLDPPNPNSLFLITDSLILLIMHCILTKSLYSHSSVPYALLVVPLHVPSYDYGTRTLSFLRGLLTLFFLFDTSFLPHRRSLNLHSQHFSRESDPIRTD